MREEEWCRTSCCRCPPCPPVVSASKRKDCQLTKFVLSSSAASYHSRPHTHIHGPCRRRSQLRGERPRRACGTMRRRRKGGGSTEAGGGGGCGMPRLRYLALAFSQRRVRGRVRAAAQMARDRRGAVSARRRQPHPEAEEASDHASRAHSLPNPPTLF